MKTASLQDQTIVALSICPLLIPVTGIITGIAMGVILAVALFLTGLSVYLLKGMIPPGYRIYMVALLAATMVGAVHMSTMALWYEISLLFGVYLPLIAVNCILLVNNEEVVLRRSLTSALGDTAKTCAIMFLLLVVIGFVRELLGSGTVFQDAGLLVGETADAWVVRLVDERFTWEILRTAPGAFIVTGLVFALFNPGENRATMHQSA